MPPTDAKVDFFHIPGVELLNAIAPVPAVTTDAVWAQSFTPKGAGLYKLSTQTWTQKPMPSIPYGLDLVVGAGYVWALAADGPVPADAVNGVVRIPLSGSASGFVHVGETYRPPRLARSIARASDGSVWLAVSGDKQGKLVRLAPAPSRFPQTQASSAEVEITLAEFQPWTLATAGPGFLWAVGGIRGQSWLTRVALRSTPGPGTLQRLGRFPAPYRLLPTSDGSVWGCGTAATFGWSARWDRISAKAQLWEDANEIRAVAEGVQGRMFLARTTRSSPQTSDVLLFKFDPVGGAGPITSLAPKAFLPGGQLIPDHHGAFWFTAVDTKGKHDGSLEDWFIGRYVPPNVEPLDQP